LKLRKLGVRNYINEKDEPRDVKEQIKDDIGDILVTLMIQCKIQETSFMECLNIAWEQIKDATEQGLLGGRSKVSTLKGEKGKEYVICVFTSDWKNEKDVMRVRDRLRELGFEKPLPYKTDADTIAKKYACKGDRKISKYWE
jgi:hypothetical protein